MIGVNDSGTERIGKMIERFGVGVVGEFQREHVGDELLQIRRQRRAGLELTTPWLMFDQLSGLY